MARKFYLSVYLLVTVNLLTCAQSDLFKEALLEKAKSNAIKKNKETIAKKKTEILNVNYIQEGNEIVVSFDIDGDNNVYLQLYYSSNNGITWHGPLKNVSGDNNFISSGKLKKIRWSVLQDQSLLIADNIQFKVVAVDGRGTFVDNRDQQSYKWIKIGKQIWMAENLLYASGRYISSPSEWKKNHKKENDSAAYCWYEDKEFYSNKYGAFYNYKAALDACPDGWRLPTFGDWYTLAEYIGNDRKPTKSGLNDAFNHIWRSSENYEVNIAYKDIYNFFNVSPGIRGSKKGEFFNDGWIEWWSIQELNSSYATCLKYRDSDYGEKYRAIELRWITKSTGANVRCIKINPEE